MLDRKEHGILFVGEHRIPLASSPFTPLDEKIHDLFPVCRRNRFDNICTFAPELVNLVPNSQIVLSGKLCKVSGTIDILKMVPVRNKVHTTADLLHPSGGIGIDEDYRFVIADF
jgi:hypothetical protein